jgi:hypothetical protein
MTSDEAAGAANHDLLFEVRHECWRLSAFVVVEVNENEDSTKATPLATPFNFFPVPRRMESQSRERILPFPKALLSQGQP